MRPSACAAAGCAAIWLTASGGACAQPPPGEAPAIGAVSSVGDGMLAGIPLDSEYLVFVIDTSGSMRQYAWDEVRQHMVETMDAYPSLQGIQVLNDEGEHMFQSYRGEWMPNTASRREAILAALGNWNAFSDSSPREGILTAIDTYYDPEKKTSLYVYSDDFSRGSLEDSLAAISSANRTETGQRKVRIHAVAFPVYYEVTGTLLTAANFAVLMRELCQQNGGSFIALPVR